MNNPFENFDNWDEDIAENTSISFPITQDNRFRLNTSDTQLQQIGHGLGKHYPANVINRNINRYKVRVEQNLDEIERLTARGINERDESFIDILTKRADRYATKLEFWVREAQKTRYERDTGVTRINIFRS